MRLGSAIGVVLGCGLACTSAPTQPVPLPAPPVVAPVAAPAGTTDPSGYYFDGPRRQLSVMQGEPGEATAILSWVTGDHDVDQEFHLCPADPGSLRIDGDSVAVTVPCAGETLDQRFPLAQRDPPIRCRVRPEKLYFHTDRELQDRSGAYVVAGDTVDVVPQRLGGARLARFTGARITVGFVGDAELDCP